MKNMLHSAVNLVFTRINYSIQFKYQVYTKIQIDMNLSDKTGILTHLYFLLRFSDTKHSQLPNNMCEDHQQRICCWWSSFQLEALFFNTFCQLTKSKLFAKCFLQTVWKRFFSSSNFRGFRADCPTGELNKEKIEAMYRSILPESNAKVKSLIQMYKCVQVCF